jgi:photosystem II stability/assembly factor-like uncharacterized protein
MQCIFYRSDYFDKNQDFEFIRECKVLRKIGILNLLITFFVTAALFGQTWQTLACVPIISRYNDVYFVTPSRGWFVNGSGQIYLTVDGGASCQLQFDRRETHFRSIGFVDSLTGWAGNVGPGEFGATDTTTIYQTIDGGRTWTPMNNFIGPKPRGLCGMHVVNDSVICAVGRVRGPAFFARTTDRGKTWVSKDMSQYAAGLIDVYFFHPDTGIAVGLTNVVHNSSSGVVLFTTDGGQTWEKRFTTTRIGEWCWKISFPTKEVGYASIQRNSQTSNHFLKTTDGGKTWQEKPFPIAPYFIQGIGFINEKLGWIGGRNAASSGYQTDDGGENWQPAGFGSQLNRFRFLNDSLGYAVGQQAYKYTAKTTGVASREPGAPFGFALSQNYPNPFLSGAKSPARGGGNSSTTIRFTLAKASNVKITVYDLNGRQINEILQQTLAAGAHAITWNAVDQEGNPVGAGVYFYKLDAGNFTATRKMILLQ